MSAKHLVLAAIALSAVACANEDAARVEVDAEHAKFSFFKHPDSASGAAGFSTEFLAPASWTHKNTGEGYYLTTPSGTGIDYPATIVDYGQEYGVNTFQGPKFTFRCADYFGSRGFAPAVVECTVVNSSAFVDGARDYGRFHIRNVDPDDMADIGDMLKSFEGEAYAPF